MIRCRVRCGDCSAPLSSRVVGLAGVERLMIRHRLMSGCSCQGLVVQPIKQGVRAA